MAIARAVCASMEIEPYDMAPVTQRRTISFQGSTWSIGTEVAFSKSNSSRPRNVQRLMDSRELREYASYAF